ncbi:MAG TPA: enoyl-CoA hydratase/isomerase family protein [Salinisphaeraceae bacterium]|nr:enoyl-CoA hydratase/isomerase family protein [Salinisphaeraceae bacterium]
MTSNDGSIDSIQFSEQQTTSGHVVAYVLLNAPKALNALSKAMIDRLIPKLAEWRVREDVVCVVLHGAGEKAFCAGGDIIGLYNAMRAAAGAPSPDAEAFFAAEYRLDYTIHNYPKPILCWGTGAVMGGGLGILAGASHRVVTENTTIAMPEVGIGLFPDVAAGWFLNRMPGRVGLFLALTGSPIHATDAWLVGLADARIEAAQREAVFAALADVRWQGDTRIDASLLSGLLRGFESGTEDWTAANVLAHRDVIARVTDASDVASVQAALAQEDSDDKWLQRAAKTMASASPTSMVIAFEQWHIGAHLSLAQTFQREFAIAVQCTRHPDFAEGIRALLVDKDKQPAWSPARLEDVTMEHIAEHFRLPADYHEHPLADLA